MITLGSNEICCWSFYGHGKKIAEVCCTAIVYATDRKNTKVRFAAGVSTVTGRR
jgi:BTB/POZ domain-containing adapter for CUL3-mediated RhoA degradation protein